MAGWAAVILTVGFLLVVLGGHPRDAAINPGVLTTAHSGESLDCQSCHTETSPSELATVFDPHFLSQRAFANSELCLNCHGSEIGDWLESARFAHGWSREEIQQKVEAVGDGEALHSENKTDLAVWIAAKGPLPAMGQIGELACATCHQEHHGSDYVMTELSNKQCQVCHQNQFHGFSDGHPSFAETGYPYSRRTRIFFDHESHYGKHFAADVDKFIPGFDTKRPYDDNMSCAHCHEPDQNGEFMKLRGFEVSCGACHEDAVKGGDALTILALPEVQPNVAKGHWPASGYGLLPSVRLLLSKDLQELLSTVDVDPDYGVLSLIDEGSGDTAKLVATELQNLFLESWSEGAGVLAERIEESGYLPPEDAEALFGGLSVDTVRNFLFPGIRWELGDFVFPELDLDELNRRLGGAHSRSIGAWPERAAASVTPLMVHLLSPRASLREDLNLLKPFTREDGSIELSDLLGASDAQIGAVENLAWGVRALFQELQESGAPFLEQFESLRGGILDAETSESVLDRVFLMARSDDAFMSRVGAEMTGFNQGHFPAAVEREGPKGKEDVPSIGQGDDAFGGGDDDAFGGGDDDFGTSEPAKGEGAGGDDDFGGGDDDFGTSEPAKGKASGGDDDFGGGDDDFGASEPVKGKASGGDDDFGGGDDDFGASEPVAEKEGIAPKGIPRVYEPSLTDWQKLGGWHYDTHAINYTARGHADPVIMAWIDSSIDAINSPDAIHRQNGRLVLDHVLGWKDGVNTDASGKCFKCHTVDRDVSSGVYHVNWHEAYGTRQTVNPSSELTRFSHAKHSIAIKCVSCHVPGESGDYAEFFPARGSGGELSDSAQFSPNFMPVNQKESCANCHQKGLSGEDCLQCHEYHVRPR